jgi:hypothetical protein
MNNEAAEGGYELGRLTFYLTNRSQLNSEIT